MSSGAALSAENMEVGLAREKQAQGESTYRESYGAKSRSVVYHNIPTLIVIVLHECQGIARVPLPTVGFPQRQSQQKMLRKVFIASLFVTRPAGLCRVLSDYLGRSFYSSLSGPCVSEKIPSVLL